ncbi:gluconokinase [Ferruginibacter sp. SUN106]|uniref:gluconokinase n=1 Tax=Ferruginibacter sp. SUN106 TaxID=2978348 RepID=UPI003D36F934
MDKRIIYIMGVSGSGKTTIGELLAQKTGLPFFDADDFHSQANKEKMRSGHPLTDEDRKDWLQKIHTLTNEQIQNNGAIIACSALKEEYRQTLSNGIENILWVFLRGDYETIYRRLKNRTGHYMPSSLLQSQFDSLEIPVDAFTIDIEKQPADIVADIIQQLDKK